MYWFARVSVAVDGREYLDEPETFDEPLVAVAEPLSRVVVVVVVVVVVPRPELPRVVVVVDVVVPRLLELLAL